LLLRKMKSLIMRLLSNRPNRFRVNKTSIIFFLILFLIFLQLLIFSPSEINLTSNELKTSEQIKKMAQQQSSKEVEQKLRGLHLLESPNNTKGWELFAEEAEGSSNTSWVLKVVKIIFFADDESQYTVSGDVGEIDSSTKDIVIRGGVVTESTNGYLFKSNEVRFLAQHKHLYTDNSVEMSGPGDKSGKGFVLTGMGLRIDLKINKMYVLSNVEAKKEIDGNLFEIRSQTAEFSNKTEHADFSGNVEMTYELLTLQSPTARFQYSNTERRLKTVTLNGGVRMKEVGKFGVCRSLEIDLEQDKMTLRGAPKVQMGEDEITGDEIVFLEGGKKVKVSNVRALRQDVEKK
jgi:LPS export ABC transporter protein LptC